MNTFFFHLHHRESPRNQADEMQGQSLLTLPILSLWELRSFTVMEGKEPTLRETRRTGAVPPLRSHIQSPGQNDAKGHAGARAHSLLGRFSFRD